MVKFMAGSKDKISMDDLTSGRSFDHWATANQMEALIGLTIGQPRYHKFMENFAKGMSSGKIGMEKAFRDAGRGMERFAPSLPIATAGLKETGKEGKKAGDRLSILSAMTSGAATRLESFQRSAARVDGTLQSTYKEFTSLLKTTVGLAGVIGGGIASMTGLSSAMGGVMGKMGIFGKALGSASQALPAIAGVMGAAVGVVMGVVDDFGQSLRKTADFGISFGKSFMDLRVELGKAGLGLDSLEKQLAQNSEAFALMGSNVHEGVRRFAEWRDNMNVLTHTTKSTLGYFENLGFAAEDLHDMFLKDVRNRRLSGWSQEQAIERTTKRLNELAKEAKIMSELTGESRKLQMQQNIEMRSDPQWQAFLGTQSKAVRTALEENLEMMATTLPFEPKQKKAIQDSIRMGGNISLLNESVFGDAFAFLRYMPEQRKLLENMVKDVAQGETIPGDLKKNIAGYIISWGKFAESEQGKFFSMFGKNIIPEIGVMFENLQAYNRILKKPDGLKTFLEGITQGLDRQNAVIARQQQASLILGNLMASAKGQQLLETLTGTELEAALQGKSGAFEKLANIMVQASTAEGFITQAIATMTIDAASAVIHVTNGILEAFGLGTPGAGSRVAFNQTEQTRVNEAGSMFSKDGIFMQLNKSRRNIGGDWRKSKTGGQRSMALQELLTQIQGSDAAGRNVMSQLETKYTGKYQEALGRKAKEQDFDMNAATLQILKEFKQEITRIAREGGVDINAPSKSGSLAQRIFRSSEIKQLALLQSSIAISEKNLVNQQTALDALHSEIQGLTANPEIQERRENEYRRKESAYQGLLQQIKEDEKKLEDLQIRIATPHNMTVPISATNPTVPPDNAGRNTSQNNAVQDSTRIDDNKRFVRNESFDIDQTQLLTAIRDNTNQLVAATIKGTKDSIDADRRNLLILQDGRS